MTFDIYYGGSQILDNGTMNTGNYGAFTFMHSGASSTAYVYIDNFYARNYRATEPAWGSFGSATYGPPTVTTNTPLVLSTTMITAKGNITATGAESPTVRGFKYGLSQTDTWSTTENGTFSTGDFTGVISGLSANTTYYIRAYVTNSAGTSYGSYVSFTTPKVWDRTDGWTKRKSFTLSRASGAVTNYQMKINVYKNTGTDDFDAYKAIFSITGAGGYQYSDMSGVANYTIQSGDYIEYDVKWTAATDKIAFDYTCTDATALRNSSVVDQNGVNMHPVSDMAAYAVGTWYSRKAALPAGHVGKVISYFDIVSEAQVTSTPTGYIKNIRITDGAGNIRKQILIGNESSVTTASHISSSGSLTSFAHQTLAEANMYVGTNVQNDLDDLRFTNSSGTLLDYWVESYTSGVSATVWVEFDSIGTSATTFYMYYGNASASAPDTPYNMGVATFIFFDNFERGNNGDELGNDWLSGWNALISTDHSVSGTRSVKIGGSSSGLLRRTVTASDNIAFRYKMWKEDASHCYLMVSGNGSYRIASYVDASENIWAGPATNNDTAKDMTPDAWRFLDFQNWNWTAHTFDIYYDNSIAKSGAAISSDSSYGNLVEIQNDGSGAANDVYVDDFLVRNYRSTEPVWGTWGNEESYSTINFEKVDMQGVDIQGF
jgi:hypothetical protein